jgi:hypothetical protein
MVTRLGVQGVQDCASVRFGPFAAEQSGFEEHLQH